MPSCDDKNVLRHCQESLGGQIPLVRTPTVISSLLGGLCSLTSVLPTQTCPPGLEGALSPCFQLLPPGFSLLMALLQGSVLAPCHVESSPFGGVPTLSS